MDKYIIIKIKTGYRPRYDEFEVIGRPVYSIGEVIEVIGEQEPLDQDERYEIYNKIEIKKG